MEIVTVIDENYLKYFNIFVKHIKKHNPTAHITVVSPTKLNTEYENVVIEIPNTFKHRENDRITDATYLKLYLEKLPFDKIIYIDSDVICKKPLTELWETEVEYIGLAESHNYGKAQAKELNVPKYGLAGMMVMNLKNLRKIKFMETAIEKLTTDDFSDVKMFCHEETILNKHFYDKLTFLDKKYNYCYNRAYDKPLKDNEIVLLHFPGSLNKSVMLRMDRKLSMTPNVKTTNENNSLFRKGMLEKHIIKNPLNYNYLAEIKKFIKGKRVAIVGNAQSIFDKSYGKEIDKYDVVIRFNKGYTIKPESQGSKTDIVINACKTIKPEELKSYNAKYIIGRLKKFYYIPMIKYYFEDQDIVRASKGMGARCSSGRIGIDLAYQSDAKSIDLYGFDFEQTPTFYNNPNYKTMHKYDAEEEVALYMEKMGIIKIHR